MPLPDQDRSRWDAAQVAEGRAVLDRALSRFGRGPYALQAAIASLQMHEFVDWSRIAALYTELVRLTGSPVADLNRIVAVAEVHGPGAALELVERLPLDHYQYFHSTRAELLRRLGRTDEARHAYRRALDLARAGHERHFLEQRLAQLSGGAGGQ